MIKFNKLKQCRYGYMLYNSNDEYIGRSFEIYGEFSEGEVELFRALIRPSNLVIEAGANIGAHTVFFAQAVGAGGVVFAYEPQRLIFQTLCANVALNSLPNVYCYEAALGELPGKVEIPYLDPCSEQNFGGLNLERAGEGQEVPLVTIDSLNLPICHFIKVDVEGMELQVLKGANETIKRFKPILYVEDDRQEKSEAVLAFLKQHHYTAYRHRPMLFNSQNFLQNPENIFPNIASINLLCIHESAGTLDQFARVI